MSVVDRVAAGVPACRRQPVDTGRHGGRPLRRRLLTFCIESAPAVSEAPPAKYLTVVLENEAYGIAVLKVREIIRQQKITPVPQMPEFVKGVINLRAA
jgi:hypothetical protein